MGTTSPTRHAMRDLFDVDIKGATLWLLYEDGSHEQVLQGPGFPSKCWWEEGPPLTLCARVEHQRIGAVGIQFRVGGLALWEQRFPKKGTRIFGLRLPFGPGKAQVGWGVNRP